MKKEELVATSGEISLVWGCVNFKVILMWEHASFFFFRCD